MNALLRCMAAGLTMAGLTACTGTHQVAKTQVQPQQSMPVQAQGDRSVVDTRYVAQVEHVARRRGVEVKWVNPPRKRPAEVARR